MQTEVERLEALGRDCVCPKWQIALDNGIFVLHDNGHNTYYTWHVYDKDCPVLDILYCPFCGRELGLGKSEGS